MKVGFTCQKDGLTAGGHLWVDSQTVCVYRTRAGDREGFMSGVTWPGRWRPTGSWPTSPGWRRQRPRTRARPSGGWGSPSPSLWTGWSSWWTARHSRAEQLGQLGTRELLSFILDWFCRWQLCTDQICLMPTPGVQLDTRQFAGTREVILKNIAKYNVHDISYFRSRCTPRSRGETGIMPGNTHSSSGPPIQRRRRIQNLEWLYILRHFEAFPFLYIGFTTQNYLTFDLIKIEYFHKPACF